MPERLQKLLSRAGVASRRAAERLIVGGRVTVNGRVVSELGAKVDPAKDDIRVDGERLHKPKLAYFALYKPSAIVTTLDDPEGRPTVRDLLPRGLGRVYPVGRLDYHSAGLLLLTNDGDLAARLMHPRYRIPRTYRVKVAGHPAPAALLRLRRGVKLEDGVSGPAQVDVESKLPGKTWLRITIREGRRREIRRMCEAIGHLADRLVRVRYGPIDLGRLRPGELRPLTEPEVRALRAAVAPGRKVTLTSRRVADKQRDSSRSAAMRGVEQSGSSRGS